MSSIKSKGILTTPAKPVAFPGGTANVVRPPIAAVADRFAKSRPTKSPAMKVSTIYFELTAEMPEAKAYAAERGWLAEGFTHLSLPWVELHYTTDGWQLTRVLKSSDVPSPIVNGTFYLPFIDRGTEVEFAIHVGLACHAPSDIAGHRDTGDFWLNNDSKNYRQVTQ